MDVQCFVEELAKLNIGANNTLALNEHLSKISGFEDNEDVIKLEVMNNCTVFFIYGIQGDSDKSRIQVAMHAGPVRRALLAGLAMLPNVKLTSGAAPPGYLEKELSDWIQQLSV